MLKNLSNRVSAKTIEETYTDADIEIVKKSITTGGLAPGGKLEYEVIADEYTSSTGFTFDYPMRWLNDASDFKAIGIRRLNVIPSSHVFTITVGLEWKIDVSTNDVPDIKEGYFRRDFTESIIPENNLEEIMHNIINSLNNSLATTELFEGANQKYPVNEYPAANFISFYYDFDYRTGNLKIGLNKEEHVTEAKFAIGGGTFAGTQVSRSMVSLLRFLNQPINLDSLNMLQNASEEKSFTNVWDRKTLQFHASFSDNKRGFIGLNGDFYDTPSVFYDPPTNTSRFSIKFTTDGIHEFLPRYCRFYIGLCYVRNYKNSLVTK